MSRSGYTDECDGWELVRWRGAVNSAIRGKRGQAFLNEMVTALDAMQEKRLVSGLLETADGDCCALGAVGLARSMDLTQIDPDDLDAVARTFGIAWAMAAEIMYVNDDDVDDFVWEKVEICGPLRRWESRVRVFRNPSPHADVARWVRMRAWAADHIKKGSQS